MGWAHAGEAENYEEIPTDWQDRVTTDCPDSQAFAVTLEGDSMEPKFSDGDCLIVQPNVRAYSGCYVVAKFANDGIIFRRMEVTETEIILLPLNARWPVRTYKPDDFRWIYPVYARITKLMKTR